MFRVCDLTSASKRDIEPAVHLNFIQIATIVTLREFGSECGIVAVNLIL